MSKAKVIPYVIEYWTLLKPMVSLQKDSDSRKYQVYLCPPVHFVLIVDTLAFMECVL